MDRRETIVAPNRQQASIFEQTNFTVPTLRRIAESVSAGEIIVMASGTVDLLESPPREV
jgi:hypothetical protein